MRLLASMQNDNRWHELLADIKAMNDTGEKWGEHHVRRRITGNVLQRGPIWDAYLRFSQRAATPNESPLFQSAPPAGATERLFVKVRRLQVDHDLYAAPAWMNVEGNTIRLILCELYKGSIEDYANNLRERNRLVDDLYRKFDQGMITVNDLRAFSSEEQLLPPQGTQLIQAELLLKARQLYLENPMSQVARNYIPYA
jgi:hypothetical protein